MFYKLIRHFFSVAVTSSIFLLSGCNYFSSNEVADKTKTTAAAPISIAALAERATGFTVGSQMSARTAYVFFDAQCPHCGALWNASKPLKSQIKFIWIPVSLINASSTSQGATLLASADPAAAMDEHEVSLLSRQGGISAASNLAAQKASIAKNTELMTSFGIASVPAVIGTNARTGALVTNEGSMSTAALASLLGLQAPTTQVPSSVK